MIVFQVPPVRPEHNLLTHKIANYLKPHLNRDLTMLIDTYCYITHEMLERVGHFKGGDSHEYMQKRLLELGAGAGFIAATIVERLKEGIMTSTYAPDVCVIQDADFHNSFRVPIWIGEIISKDSREYDLYFKAYLYERLGVQEYFVFETGRRSGKLLRAYELKSEPGTFSHYEDIRFEGASAHSQLLSIEVPVEWKV